MARPAGSVDVPLSVVEAQGVRVTALEALAPTVTTGTDAFTNATPLVLASIPIAEGESVTITAILTAGLVDTGVTLRSNGEIVVGASRSVGGSPLVSEIRAAEEGTITTGAIDAAVNGNAIDIRVTYGTDGTLTWSLRVTVDRLAIPQP